jgi:hypothetical protein
MTNGSGCGRAMYRASESVLKKPSVHLFGHLPNHGRLTLKQAGPDALVLRTWGHGFVAGGPTRGREQAFQDVLWRSVRRGAGRSRRKLAGRRNNQRLWFVLISTRYNGGRTPLSLFLRPPHLYPHNAPKQPERLQISPRKSSSLRRFCFAPGSSSSRACAA